MWDVALCALVFKKMQCHGAVVRATGEEKFGCSQTNELISHQS